MTFEEISLLHKDGKISDVVMRFCIGKALTECDIFGLTTGRKALIHPLFNSENIFMVLCGKSTSLKQSVLELNIITPDHIDKALDDDSSSVAIMAIKSQTASTDNINKALKHSDPDIARAAIMSVNFSEANVETALECGYEYSLLSLLKYPHITERQLLSLKDSEFWGVRRFAVKHPNSGIDHIAYAMNDENEYVAQEAMRIKKERNL